MVNWSLIAGVAVGSIIGTILGTWLAGKIAKWLEW